MLDLGAIDAARLASLATGRGGIPTTQEWPLVLAVLALLAFVGTRLLMGVGLTLVESSLVAALSPLLVLVDAPLGKIAPDVGLGANFAGCLIPSAVAVKIVLERRAPWAESLLLIAAGILAAFLSSRVDPDRGVLLQYRLPAVALALLAAGLLFRKPETAGAAGFAAGALGVVFGADVLHLPELAVSASGGRVILGGAGLLDGIVLVAVLSGVLAAMLAGMLRFLLTARLPKRAAA